MVQRHTQARGESGQAAIESAIILPLYVFLLLGTLQLSLMHQARLVTKYAAYKAARAGALHHAHPVMMEKAALAVLLPLTSENYTGTEYIQPITSPQAFYAKWSWAGFKDNLMPDVGLPYVEVTTCGPTLQELRQAGLTGPELDFDDPDLAGQPGWRESQLTKLRVQATFHYRMPIPFANWVIHAVTMNRNLWFLNRKSQDGAAPPVWLERYSAAASMGVYILPIRAAYTMRMQSNVYPSLLPEENRCVTPHRY